MRVETVSESAGTGPYASVLSARWQEGELSCHMFGYTSADYALSKQTSGHKIIINLQVIWSQCSDPIGVAIQK